MNNEEKKRFFFTKVKAAMSRSNNLEKKCSGGARGLVYFECVKLAIFPRDNLAPVLSLLLNASSRCRTFVLPKHLNKSI